MAVQEFIVDTNVLVAGLARGKPDSPPASIMNAMASGNLLYLLSPDLMHEYRRVLLRPKLASWLGLSEDAIHALLDGIAEQGLWREPSVHSTAPEPGDNHVWNLLQQGENAILITGDKLLLANPPDGRLVITPRAYVDTFAKAP